MSFFVSLANLFPESKLLGLFGLFRIGLIVILVWTLLLANFDQILVNAQTAFGSNNFNKCSYNGTSCESANVSSNGLRLWYDANSTTSYPGSGQIIYDLSGNGANGTLGISSSVASDDPTFNSTGIKSFKFVNAREIINFGLAANFSNDFTVETWFKRANNNDTVAGCERLININAVVNTRTSLSVCGKSIAGRGRTVDNTAAWTKDTGFIANTEWQMATLSYNSTSQTMRVYANGVLHSSSTQVIMTAASSGNIIAGASASGSNNLNFVGEMAVIRAYNRVISDNEVINNFDSEKSRFGFTNSTIGTILPTTLNFGNYQTRPTQQTVNILFDQIKIVDRRSTFAPYSVNLGISNFVSSSSIIKKENISLTLNSPIAETGSGLFNTSGQNGTLIGALNILTNMENNGGGTFIYKPTLSLTIPPYSKIGNYTAIISISVS